MMMILNGKQLKKPEPAVPVSSNWPFKPDESANAKSSA